MDIKESIVAALKEFVLPEINMIKEESKEIKAILGITNKRLDDMNTHLADQSRRIDEMNKRIDETNKRIDAVRDELVGRIDETNKRIDEAIGKLAARYDNLSDGLNRLYEVIVRREEHAELQGRLFKLEGKYEDMEKEIGQLKANLAA